MRAFPPPLPGLARILSGLAPGLVGLALALSGLAGSLLVPGEAAGQESAGDRSPHSEGTLVAEGRWIRPGEPFTAGLRLSLEPEWHTYWSNPGDSGEPASISWRLPEGFTAGPIQWPVPERIPFPPLVSYGYHNEVLLPVEITPPAGLAPGDTVRLAGTAYWLVCIEDCFPAEAELSLALPVRDVRPEPDPATAPLFETARARLPVTDPRWSAVARATDGWIGLRVVPPAGVPADAVADFQFFASESDVLDHAAEQRWAFEDGSFTVRLARSGFSADLPDSLRGVLVLSAGAAAGTDLRASDATAGRYAVGLVAPVEVASDRSGGTSALGDGGTASALGLGIALLFAFLGGAILNLMPCVFPVLGLKVLGFVAHGDEGRGSATREGAAFALGVLVSFWVLGALLLVLRGAGESVGWGFQLQSPLFVGAMALLFFLLALVLLGVLEVGVGLTRLGRVGTAKPASGTRTEAENRNPASGCQDRGRGSLGSFGSGVLATIVATPCTAPFMGAALGWALVRPPGETMLVFTALGAGMATPYVALSLAPGLVERLPPPGRWMETLKQALAFPLLATVVWLAWVFGLQTGVDGLTGLLAALLALGLAAWIAGRWGGLAAPPARRLVARAAAALVGVSAAFLLVRAAGSEPDEVSHTGAAEMADWLPWSAAAATEARAGGASLFLDFTAAWCLSCQVNERVVLNAAEVRDAFREHGVPRMKADWTRRDPAITDALAALGRSSVPVYALYPSGGGDPVLLPSVLTKKIVLDALAEHAPAPGPDGG